ncbi:MAG: DUF721 domain-containing protein [Treponema sp.]|nr:DUF721 domain-containing protein [Treponema sp.]
MKTAGDILSALFDERFMNKAQGYSKFFNSWTDITAKNGIAAAAAHSRIKDLDRGIVLIEMDHPGWKQILQTKQSKFLNDFRIRFPELEISGISLILGSSEQDSEPEEEKQELSQPAEKKETPSALPCLCESSCENPTAKGFDEIKDEEFKETLKSLGKTIAEREKR